MSDKKTKLELTWIGKENRPKLEPRILLEEPSLSHTAARPGGGATLDNLLIEGDNLLALRALEHGFSGQVKCVFIDPPYNTGAAFEQYDDMQEHSLWLSLMRERVEILRRLLSDVGTMWVTLDDNEVFYFKVMADEVFGRRNFLGSVAWEKSDSPRMDAHFFSTRHDFVLAYAKDAARAEFHRLPTAGVAEHYDQVDADGRQYYLKPLRAMGGQGDSREARPNLYYAMTAPDGTQVLPVRTDGSDGAWRWSKEKVAAEASRIDWKRGRSGWAPYFRIYAEPGAGRPAETIWPHAEVGSNRTSKAEVKALSDGETPFGTPKPEALVERVLRIATREGDLVLDSFLGSGTTAAVAHKMRRRWIGVELGEHARTLCVSRLRKVVDGEDAGGVTTAVGWAGGGGFRFYRLAPSLLARDKWGNYVISDTYRKGPDAGARLAEAMCKLEGFTYAPSSTTFWMHGTSTEQDFIYVTTQTLTHEQLVAISEEVGSERTLLICCGAFVGKPEQLANLTVKKIPAAVLTRCEWGKDDYSLKVAAVTGDEPSEPEAAASAATGAAPRRRKKPVSVQELSLFAPRGAK